jgi:hypothetical protein
MQWKIPKARGTSLFPSRKLILPPSAGLERRIYPAFQVSSIIGPLGSTVGTIPQNMPPWLHNQTPKTRRGPSAGYSGATARRPQKKDCYLSSIGGI